MWIPPGFTGLRDQGRRFPFGAFRAVGTFDDVVRAVEVHPGHGGVAAGIHRRLRSEAFFRRERDRGFPAAGERPEGRLDHSRVLPDHRRPPFPVDRYPGFGGGTQGHFADVGRRGPAAADRAVDRLHEELGARVAFPDDRHVVVAVDGYLWGLGVMRTRHDFAFQFGLGEVFRRAPAFAGWPVGAFDNGVDPVPAVPDRRRVAFGIEDHVWGAGVLTLFGDIHRRQPSRPQPAAPKPRTPPESVPGT